MHCKGYTTSCSTWFPPMFLALSTCICVWLNSYWVRCLNDFLLSSSSYMYSSSMNTRSLFFVFKLHILYNTSPAQPQNLESGRTKPNTDYNWAFLVLTFWTCLLAMVAPGRPVLGIMLWGCRNYARLCRQCRAVLVLWQLKIWPTKWYAKLACVKSSFEGLVNMASQPPSEPLI